ncbi:hypothetical protein Ct9H90mP29_21310 [bacterium]|nr:MAG: hypothetical protein Ct9H90mP29_21310 [bacterium]
MFITVPYGKTLSQFIDVRRKQFNEIQIGRGISRISVGFYGSKNFKYKYSGRVYGQTLLQFSTTSTLNTPALLFSGGHTNPDSILSLVGNSYKFDQGSGLTLNLGTEIERLKNRLRFRVELLTTIRARIIIFQMIQNGIFGWRNMLEIHHLIIGQISKQSFGL